MNQYFGVSSSGSLDPQTITILNGIPASSWNYLETINQYLSQNSAPLFNDVSLLDKLFLRNSGFQLSIQAPVLAANYALTLPTTAGTANQYLQTNGSGTLNWASITLPNQPLDTTSSPSFVNIGIGQNSGAQALEITGNIKFNDGANYTTFYTNSNLVQIASQASKYHLSSQTEFSYDGKTWTNYQISDGLLISSVGLGSIPETFIYTDGNYRIGLNSCKVGINQAPGTQALEVNGAIKALSLNLTTAGGFTINSKTPTDAQWGYLTGLNQALSTTSMPKFNICYSERFWSRSAYGFYDNLDFTKGHCFRAYDNVFQFMLDETIDDIGMCTASASQSILFGSMAFNTTLAIKNGKVGINQLTGTEAFEVTGRIVSKQNGTYDTCFQGISTIGDECTLYLGISNITNAKVGVACVRDATLGYYGSLFNTNSGVPGSISWLTNRVGINQKPGTEVLEVNGNIKASGRLMGSGVFSSIRYIDLNGGNVTVGPDDCVIIITRGHATNRLRVCQFPDQHFGVTMIFIRNADTANSAVIGCTNDSGVYTGKMNSTYTNNVVSDGWDGTHTLAPQGSVRLCADWKNDGSTRVWVV